MTVLSHPARLRAASVPRVSSSPALAWTSRLSLLAIAWGAIAIGSVYPWAYWPLVAASVICGCAGLCLERSVRVAAVSRVLTLSAVAAAAAIFLQLVPLPLRYLGAARVQALNALDPRVAAGLRSVHALSIAPGETLTALTIAAAMLLLVAGLARLLSILGPRLFVEQLAALGCALALAGIIQKPLYHGRIFGVWRPLYGGDPFGPFVNKNHFAGWMLMALPLVFGLLCAGIVKAMRGVKPDWRSRVLWFSTPDANRLLLLAMCAAVMSLSVVLTMSRSGISALALSIVATGLVAIRNTTGKTRKAAAIAYFVLVLAAVVWWAGAAAIIDRFASANWSEFNNRRDIWLDTLGIIRRFPLAGTGVNTFGVATLLYQTRGLDQHFAQAHNDYLQLLSDGGLLVVVPVLACIGFFVRDVRRRFAEDVSTTAYWLRVGAVTGLAAIALQESVDFSLQMPGNAVMFAALCAIALHRTRGRLPMPNVEC